MSYQEFFMYIAKLRTTKMAVKEDSVGSEESETFNAYLQSKHSVAFDAYFDGEVEVSPNLVFEIDKREDRELLISEYYKSSEHREPLPELSKRFELVDRLSAYMNKIESRVNQDGESDYAYGFRYFRRAQACNRKLNYYLAKILLLGLTKGEEAIETVFADLLEKRFVVMEVLRMGDNIPAHMPGIWSSELCGIINDARSAPARSYQAGSL